jgi:hypothetical protein
LISTGDDKGEESKAAIVKKLSEAYSDNVTFNLLLLRLPIVTNR